MGSSRRGCIGRDEALKLLSGHIDNCVHCIRDGLFDYRRIPDDLRVIFTPTARATALNSCVASRARRVFEGDPSVKIDEVNEFPLFVYNGQVGFRFKKVDQSGRPSNLPTERQRKISAQQLIIPGVKTLDILNFVYRVNATWTGLEFVKLSCFKDGDSLWSATLNEQLDVVPLFGSPEEVVDGESDSPVILKGVNQKKKG